MERLDGGDDHAGGEQGAFGRIRGSVVDDHALDVMDEWIEEVGGGRDRGRHGQEHLAGGDLAGFAVEAGVVEIAHAEHEERGAEAVAVLDEVGVGVWEVSPRPIEADRFGGIAFFDR